MPTLDQLHSFIKQHQLFHPEERVLIAVSGGRDSVLLARLFNDAGFRFGIAHCNFNLRGDDSRQDEQFTKDLAAQLDVPFYSTVFDTAQYASEHHVSIQMAARDLRYAWLEKIRSDFSYDYIAVAHHKNDSAETMLLNLTRGTGIAGMHGILPRRNKIIRPLLFLNRDEIDGLITEQQIAYREDGSNLSAKYARNKIRLEVIPILKQLNPSLEETFEANSQRFAELETVLNLRVEEIRKELFRSVGKQEIEIDLGKLKELVPRNTLLFELLKPYGFTEFVISDLTRSWDGEPGKIFRSLAFQLVLDRNKLILSPTAADVTLPVSISADDNEIRWNELTFRVSVATAPEHQVTGNQNLACIDFDLLKFPLTLRTWTAGDYFYPLGMRGKKKLSDFFIEKKVAVSRKKSIGIVCNSNGEIIWIAGLRLDDRYKITGNTKKVFILEQFT